MIKTQIEILSQGADNWNTWRNNHANSHPNFSDSYLVREIFQGMNFENTTFDYCNLYGAIFRKCNAKHASFNGSNLNCLIGELDFWAQDTEFTDSDLSFSSFYYTDLSGVQFRNTNLNSVRFSGTNLSRTSFINTSFDKVKLDHSILNGTYIGQLDFSTTTIDSSIFANVDLSQCKGLDKAEHLGASSIGIDTITRSGGNIPEAFLLKCKVPEEFISYARSLKKTGNYSSCFISYSSKDKEFAHKLYHSLVGNNIRCWLDSEHLIIGDKTRQVINDSIQAHDKLLLILSKNSIKSSWVEDETEAALERERREKIPVLFPINIDNAIWRSKKAWAAALRRTRHIGDFSDWKKNSYQDELQRLLRDLTRPSQ